MRVTEAADQIGEAAVELAERVIGATGQIRDAAEELAERDARRGREAVEKLVGDARDTLANFEDLAEQGIARLTRK